MTRQPPLRSISTLLSWVPSLCLLLLRGQQLCARLDAATKATDGGRLKVGFNMQKIHLFDGYREVIGKTEITRLAARRSLFLTVVF